MILLDTHVMVWSGERSPRLGRRAREIIEQAFQADGVAVSAISFWEISMLVEKGRLDLDFDLAAWRNDFIEKGLIELPVTGEIGIIAAGLESIPGDPADRIIAATALHHSLTLVTADERLLKSRLTVKRVDAGR